MKSVAFFIPHQGCPRQCVFCDQNQISGASSLPTVEEINRTLLMAAEERGEDVRNTEIAFFGGSFTAIAPKLRRQYLDVAGQAVTNAGYAGIRFSTRPDCLPPKIIEELRAYPITHVELGAQSMDDRVLALTKRGHTRRQVEQSSRAVKKEGWKLTLQMMVGLPGENPEDAIKTAELIAALEPDSVRIYPTLVLENTELACWYQRGTYAPLELEETVEICAELLSFFEEKDIPVVRLGLHADKGLERHVLAGPYHPALRELVQGERYYQQSQPLLAGRPPGKIFLLVHPRDLSAVVGHRGRVLKKWKAQGWEVQIKADEKVPRGNLVLGK